MAKLGKAYVDITANLSPLRRGMSAARKFVSSSLKRISRSVIRYGKWAAVGFAGLSAAAVKLAMDAEESENLFTVSMGKMAEATRKWSDEMSKALGLNAYEVRRMVSTFNVMLESMGLSIDAASQMSKGLTKLAYDMASFYNLKPAEAFQKLQSGISGEIEPLKRLGILVNENTIKTWALTNRMIQQKEQMTEVQKVQARFAVIMDQTSKAQGDLQRTVNSTTNVLRSLWAQVKEAGVQFGEGLLPAVTQTAIVMRDWLSENKPMLKDWGESVGKALMKASDAFLRFIELAESGRLGAAIKKEYPTLIKFVSTMATLARWTGKTWLETAPIAQLPKISRSVEMRREIKAQTPTMGGESAIPLLSEIARNTRPKAVGEM